MFTKLHEKHDEDGFTLVELLIVIVILGILAGVVVFAVRGINQRGQTQACKTDKNTLAVAEEAYYASKEGGNGSYGSESELATKGFLATQSDLHDISLSGGKYTIAAEAGSPCP